MSSIYPLIRGMRDSLPHEAARLSHVESVFKDVFRKFSYEEVRIPVLESKELFYHGLGESSDAVGKEMYSFVDRDGKELALRPEGTASVVRALIQNSLCYNDRPRLWYEGPMFRHERPQAGRYRQFQQLGVEAFGFSEPAIDVEIIQIGNEVFRRLSLGSFVTLKINSIGSAETRARYRERLVEALTPVSSELDEDSRNRLQTNPLRILDSKIPKTKALLQDVPLLRDSLSDSAKERFDRVLELLTTANVEYTVDPNLVRGFDYYTDTVFEWVTDRLGAQDAVCAGGRYDGLAKLLGGSPTPGIGFAAGIDRIANLCEQLDEPSYRAADVYLIPMDEVHREFVNSVAQHLRYETEFRIREHIGVGNMRNKMRWADKSGATWAIIVGDTELQQRKVTVKWLREERAQLSTGVENLVDVFSENTE